ncbi:P44/Msp2 family outer membrane protein [Anaplasmataceae bacterium AB001_6]|nr:P44/Msp2 family outer membrane protein [Anaplasmataceae bacterium AB001_6]
MNLKNKVLLGLAAVAMFGISSLNGVSAASTSSKPSKSSGMYAAVFYQPSFLHSMTVTAKHEANAIGATGINQVEQELSKFNFNWLGGGIEVGYKTGGFVISGMVDMSTATEVDVEGDDNKYLAIGSDVKAAASESNYFLKLHDYRSAFFGILADYEFGMGSMAPFVGVGAGMEYTKLTFLGGLDNSETTVTEYPFAVQGRAGISYDMGSGVQPYASYTFRYVFEKEFETTVPEYAIDDASNIADNGKAKFTLNSAMKSLVQIGVRFTF